ncbi:MAG: starch-binding protein [Ruminococcus sp.]|nr:starch-binding protein [Ruminococcus sp.]
MLRKRLISLVMVFCLIASAFCLPAVNAAELDTAEVSASAELSQVGANYGLAKNIQDGNILHCFNWKYNDIKAELKNIAEAGFTSVQTSPAQPAGGGEWYWLYQPYGFYVGTNSLGSKGDLQSLCQEADKYGIKVVVDVVANHLNGDTNRVQDDLKDNQYWHSLGGVSNWADRYQVTHGEIGMRDLNSEHNYVQQVVAKYINELKGIGVDGIRWDAAKHISLPSEGCNFWPAVTNNGLYHYGEILVGPDDRGSGNEGLMKEYTNYMTVTDSSYGMTLRNSFAGGGVPSSNGNWSNRGIAADKLIYWGESHDTWSNGQDWGFSNGMSQNTIDRAYAVAASRAGTNALYFSRPGTADKNGIRSGQKGSTSFKNNEIAAVNQLKNACTGEKDYYTTGNNCAVVCRESGAVIVAGSGGGFSVNVPNGGGTTKPGTYKDLVSGSTWTVTSSNISGQIGSSGIAVLLNAKPAGPSATVTPGSQNYKTDSLTLTLNYSDATSGQYSIDGGSYQSFTNGQKITIGAGLNYGTKTTVCVKAMSSTGTSDVETYTYTKTDPSATGIYFDNSGKNWNTVYCYIYKDGNNAPKEWPGTQMQKENGNIWFFEPPAGFDNCFVLFNDGNGNQVPGANESGLQYSGSPKIYKNDSWEDFAPVNPVNPTQPVTKPTQPTQPTQSTTEATEKPTEKPVPDNFVMLGDVDSNTIVNIKDATIVQKAIAGLAVFNETERFVADVDMDGNVTIKDATLLQKYVAEVLGSTLIGTMVSMKGEVIKPTQPDPTEPSPSPTAPTQGNENTMDLSSLGGKVVAIKNNSFSTPYAYVWKSSGENVMSWPGEAMKKLNSDYYYAVVPEGCDRIIFSNNGSNQTGDLSIDGNYLIYNCSKGQWDGKLSDVADVTKFPLGGNSNNNNNNNNNNTNGNYIYVKDNASWGNVYCHSWGSDGAGTSWPGTQMEAIGGGYFRIELPSGHTGVVFNNGSGAQTGDLSPQAGSAYNNQSNNWEPYNG